MEMNRVALARRLLPLMPNIMLTALLNMLSLSRNSAKQNTTTEVTVYIIRELMKTSRPVGKLQKMFLRDIEIKGRMWISTASISPPEEDVRIKLVQAIQILGNGSETYTLPSIEAVEGEWTGYRAGASASEPRPTLSDAEHFDHLMKEVKSPVNVLYFHGGAYFLMDPSSHRQTVSNLAKRTGGRCFSVRYRLAPQHPFPAQLLDALISYLYLLSPPSGAFHKPVPSKHIVFAGDSAGGNLAVALLLLILTLRKNGIQTIRFHGRDVPLELPAGVTGNSPWLDVTHSMPSVRDNAQYDYLSLSDTAGTRDAKQVVDDIWPTSPPRAEIFCEASVLTHPLVSPMCATPEMWTDMCPVFMCTGNEGLQGGIEMTARNMYQSGGVVRFVGYEGMPHCFGMIFPTTPAGKDCLEKWAGFMVDAVEGNLHVTDKGLWMKAFSNPPQFNRVSLDQVSGVTRDEMVSLMRRSVEKATAREQDAIRLWKAQRPKL